MPHKYLVSDTVTYRRTWIIEAASDDAAFDKAVSEGPNDSLVEEQVENTPYAVSRVLRDSPLEYRVVQQGKPQRG
jgi:hypothetical protein